MQAGTEEDPLHVCTNVATQHDTVVVRTLVLPRVRRFDFTRAFLIGAGLLDNQVSSGWQTGLIPGLLLSILVTSQSIVRALQTLYSTTNYYYSPTTTS